MIMKDPVMPGFLNYDNRHALVVLVELERYGIIRLEHRDLPQFTWIVWPLHKDGQTSISSIAQTELPDDFPYLLDKTMAWIAQRLKELP